jgi:RES domain
MKDEVSAILKRIEALGSTDSDFPELVKQMHKLAALAPVSVGTICEPGTTLYRGTNHHVSLPSRIEEIWYPPADRLPGFGRANRPGSPMFYCCSDPNGAFREISTTLGQYCVLATWVAAKRVVLHDVGYSAEVLKRAGARRPLPERHKAFERSLSSDVREVRDFLALAFTDPTTRNYRVTAAIAEMLLACDGIAGIMYPAVEKSANVDNLALLPEFVRSGLRLAEASAVYIDDVAVDAIGGAVIARLKDAQDGHLLWEYTGSSTDIPPHSGVAMRIQAGEQKRITTAGQLWINGRLYDLQPGYSIEILDGRVVVRDLQGLFIGQSI